MEEVACLLSGVGELVFIGPNMDSKLYLQIFKKNLKSANIFGILETFMFYQDNKSKHIKEKM